MKTLRTIFALAATVLLVPLGAADDVVREVPATKVQSIQLGGTITQFGDNVISLRTETAVAPVQYHYSQTTQWVDEAGNVVTRESVKAGTPVTIHYAKAPDGLLISKVVVRKLPARVVETPAAIAASVPDAATTTDAIPVVGTVSQFADGAIMLKSEPAVAPVQYRFTDTTQWVDDAGNVVARDSIRTGAPVTLYYTRAANGLLVSKVVVRAAAPPTTSVTETVTTTVEPVEATGTITQFADNHVVLRTAAGAEPVQYLFSDTTKWMDETGRVVARESVKTGVPVTVYYTKSPQGFVTSKVVVRRGAAAPVSVQKTETQVIDTPAPKVVEKRKAVVEKKAAPKKVIVEEKPKVVDRPVAPVVEKKTTTTTTTERKKKDDDDDDDEDDD